MNERLPPLMTAVVGLSCLSLGGLVWLGQELGWYRSSPQASRLLDLLQSPPAEPPADRSAPRPPLLISWHSPLAQQCPAVDPRLRRQLQKLASSLPRRTFRIRTDPSNYGERYSRDAYGNRVDPTPRVVVLHETVYGIQSAISTFLTPHPNDADQVSYHTLVGLDGQVVQVLDPSRRAYGAGNSAFQGQWVITNPKVGGSINNFALHLSLETPLDGEDADPSHSGYSQAQYDATALVLAAWMRQFPIPWQNITTHRHVDLGGERADPRSFDWQALQKRLLALGVMRC